MNFQDYDTLYSFLIGQKIHEYNGLHHFSM
nr:MAG TPA: hypothetical protein [Caudoviricetes sp.]